MVKHAFVVKGLNYSINQAYERVESVFHWQTWALERLLLPLRQWDMVENGVAKNVLLSGR